MIEGVRVRTGLRLRHQHTTSGLGWRQTKRGAMETLVTPRDNNPERANGRGTETSWRTEKKTAEQQQANTHSPHHKAEQL